MGNSIEELEGRIRLGDRLAQWFGLAVVVGFLVNVIATNAEQNDLNRALEIGGIIAAAVGAIGALGSLEISQRAIDTKERIIFAAKKARTRSPEDQTTTE